LYFEREEGASGILLSEMRLFVVGTRFWKKEADEVAGGV
jgi:hypothetical protein